MIMGWEIDMQYKISDSIYCHVCHIYELEVVAMGFANTSLST